MDTGAVTTEEVCNVASNTKKQCVWSPGGAVALAPLTPRNMLKGTPCALPRDYTPATPTTPASGYAGGLLPGIKVLGAFLGEDEWCSEQLCKRVQTALEPLKGIVQLQDAPNLDTAQQAQQSLLRFCSNQTLVYFLRTMPPSVTIDAARLHDSLSSRRRSTASSPRRRARRRSRHRQSGRRASRSGLAAWASPPWRPSAVLRG